MQGEVTRIDSQYRHSPQSNLPSLAVGSNITEVGYAFTLWTCSISRYGNGIGPVKSELSERPPYQIHATFANVSGMAWHPDPLQPLELNVDLLLTAQSCWSRWAVAGIRVLVIQWNKNLLPPIKGTCACGALRVGRSSRLPSWWNLAVRHQVLTGRLRDAKDDSVKARDTCSISVCWNAHDRWLMTCSFWAQVSAIVKGWGWRQAEAELTD